MPIADAKITEENSDKFTNPQKEATVLLEKTASKLLPKEYDYAGSFAIHFYKRSSSISLGVDHIDLICQTVVEDDNARNMIKSAKDALLKYYQKYAKAHEKLSETKN